MLRSGKEHLESLRDGRVVYVGGERIHDVTRHPAFRGAAETVAAIYDMKADPANREAMSYEEEGGRHSIYFLRPQTRDDLQRRMEGHRRIAELTHGMFGRSPDHVASFVTGMALKPDVLVAPCGHPDNLLAYYKYARDNDVYTVYAVVPPQAARNPEFYQRQNIPMPSLRVVAEDDRGVTIAGMKMLATGALYANDIWIGNVIPLAPDQKKEAITCVIACNAPGLSLWSRKPMAMDARSEFDAPLAWRYDESDSMLLCDNVHVPWERVLVHDDALLSRDIYVKSPSHSFGNHQSNVRYWSKMRLLLGLCAKVANATGADQVPAVRETLGKMAAVEATIGGLVHGQINAFEAWPAPYVSFNRRIMYAGLEWCTQNYSSFIDELRTLCGGSVFQMPADVSVMRDPVLAKEFMTYWQTPQNDALARMKLFKLAWDMTGSEFAGRHLQYEKFYAGASFIIRNHSFRETDWAEFNKVVDDLMAGYDAPTK
ncbi:MAG TPA: 4-hydroxyphenylacetate 3-hydroxylase N-terminal domain-containing protein [Xanthobacteraceae bacterium]|nr:4-hydroxyphenylacetate 3-hydroxylase N-terminal domain-containing protein [Xanthobacteraceae bacterium]